MKPLTQFEKMRANRARRIAIAREAIYKAELSKHFPSLAPNGRQEGVAYFGHPLDNRRSQQ